MDQQCPQCGGDAKVFDVGTVSVENYFQRSPNYVIAEGGNEDRLPLYTCVACGHGFTPITIDSARITQWYADAAQDEVFLSDEEARKKTAQQVLKRISNIMPSGKLLDVGAGPGIFVHQAQLAGYEATGLEPSVWAVQHGKSVYGVDMIQGDADSLQDMKENSFDVVTLFDVIEHVVNPDVLLRAINRVLKPGGLLVITTPKFDSVLARGMGEKWYCIFPAHLHYFTDRSLAATLGKNNYVMHMRRLHTRYLGSSYFLNRLQKFLLGRSVVSFAEKGTIQLPINFGDEFEVYARKISPTQQ